MNIADGFWRGNQDRDKESPYRQWVEMTGVRWSFGQNGIRNRTLDALRV